MSHRILAAAAAFLLAASAACDSDDGGPTSPGGGGRLSVRLTDAPTDEVSEVTVFVDGLQIKPSGEPVMRIAGEIGPIDLLELRGTTEELVDLGVPSGDYEYVQIELDQTRSSVVEIATGDRVPLQIASEEIKVLGGFEVPAGGSAAITLDFDAAASLRRRGDGSWLLTPVIARVD